MVLECIFSLTEFSMYGIVCLSVMFSSLGAFKRSVRTVDFGKFLKCNSN